MNEEKTRPTEEQQLEVSTTVALAINMLDVIDMDVLDHMIEGQERYHVVESLMDPTRYRAEARGMDATWAVLRSVRGLIKTVRENRAGQR